MKNEDPKMPEGAEPTEWKYALERAERAKQYAEKMPDHIRPSDVRFQDPMWQWENEAKGRMVKALGLKP